MRRLGKVHSQGSFTHARTRSGTREVLQDPFGQCGARKRVQRQEAFSVNSGAMGAKNQQRAVPLKWHRVANGVLGRLPVSTATAGPWSGSVHAAAVPRPILIAPDPDHCQLALSQGNWVPPLF